ncbi:MAG: hypothetical protein OXS29_04150 [bacterium]|nr:hypothetical protein [bacterium]MDE0439103.1 hypothetical protein [bacterium]
MIPDFPHAGLAKQLPATMQEEIRAQRQVGKELYRHLRRKHQGHFLSAEAAEVIAGVATTLLGTALALEGCGLPIPPELSVVVSRQPSRDGADPRVRRGPASE